MPVFQPLQHSPVLSLNNLGVELLKQGRFQEALDVFTKSLLVLQSDNAGRDDEPFVAMVPRLAAFVNSSVPSSMDEDITAPYGSIFPFYSRTFYLKEINADQDSHEVTPSMGDELAEEDSMLAFEVVAYHCALAHHVLAILHHSDGHFLKALSLYEIVFRAMRGSDITDHPILVLMLAVTNNVGFINSHFHDHDKLQFCLHFLQELHTFVAGHEDDTGYLLLDNQEHFFFFTTSLLYQKMTLGMAAAA